MLSSVSPLGVWIVKEAPRQSVMPTAWFAVALVQQWILWTLLPGPTIALGAAQSWVGLALLIGGAAGLAYVSRHAMAAADAAHCWTRSPICLAMLTCLAGAALWFGTLTGILPIAGFVSVVSSEFVFMDEEALIARSGSRVAHR